MNFDHIPAEFAVSLCIVGIGIIFFISSLVSQLFRWWRD